ncbi:MAG: metallophosphoesterase, partial [Solirubrobacteraceae bacterium]
MSSEQTSANPDGASAAPAAETPTSSTAPSASAPALASTASVTTAFSVGWLLAELAREAGARPADRRPEGSLSSATLHGSSASMLAAAPPAKVRVRQIQAKLSRLKADLDQAGVPAQDATALDAKVDALLAEVDGGSARGAPNGRVGAATLVGEITQDTLANLTAASTRLGRAFGLGYDLANTCTLPKEATGDDLARQFGTRVVDVQEALADLASSLPAHAGRSVSLSLAQWEYWASDPKLSKHPVKWPQEGVEDALARQGQVWRSVLSGEKLGKDMLATTDYFGALRTLVSRFLKRPWVWMLLFAAVAALGGGLYLFIAQHGTLVRIAGAFLSALGAVGISTATLKRALSDVAKEIETQVWDAELDYAIADAVTVPPGDWRITLKKIDLPPPRGLDPNIAANARTVHRISQAIIGKRSKLSKRWQVQKYLHEKGTYETLDGVITAKGKTDLGRRMKIAKNLIKRDTLGHEPERVAAGAPGRIVSGHRASPDKLSAFVWTFRHGRAHDIKEYDDYNAARAAARLPHDASKDDSPVLDIDAGPTPPPIRHATDRRKLRRAEAEVRKRLTPAHQKLALQSSSPIDRLALRARRGKGSPDVFIPRDPYLSLVQNALERRMKFRQASEPPAGAGSADRQAADGTSVALGDQLFDKFGPDDFGWMETVVEAGLTALAGDKHPFGTKPTDQKLGEQARLVLLADWGTGTPRALKIAELARQRLEQAEGPECHLVHLGDVYYCGLPGEYRSRFLDRWPGSEEHAPNGPVTSWNLNGNHDMYSGGQGYFDVISHPPFAQQAGTSCFRLWNDHWQFIALDTAYADNDLYEAQLPWLERWVDEFRAGAQSRRTVLLSHHQLGST